MTTRLLALAALACLFARLGWWKASAIAFALLSLGIWGHRAVEVRRFQGNRARAGAAGVVTGRLL